MKNVVASHYNDDLKPVIDANCKLGGNNAFDGQTPIKKISGDKDVSIYVSRLILSIP